MSRRGPQGWEFDAAPTFELSAENTDETNFQILLHNIYQVLMPYFKPFGYVKSSGCD